MIASKINENNLKFVNSCFNRSNRHKLTAPEVWALLGENWDEFISDIVPDSDYDNEPIEAFRDLDLESIERIVILMALEENHYRQKDAAVQLGITARALNYKIQKHGLRHSTWRKNVE